MDLAAIRSALLFTDRAEEGDVPDMDGFLIKGQQVVRACRKHYSVILSIEQFLIDLGVDATASPAVPALLGASVHGFSGVAFVTCVKMIRDAWMRVDMCLPLYGYTNYCAI